MTSTPSARVAAVVLAVAALCAGDRPKAQVPAAAAPVVYAAEVDSVIHPVSAEYMIETIAAGRSRGCGARGVHPAHAGRPRRFHARHRLAHALPRRRRWRSSSHRRARARRRLASSSRLRPTSRPWRQAPTSARRIRWRAAARQMDETMAKKAEEDVAAYARTLATTRHRNVALATEAVRNSRAFTEDGGAERVAAAHRSDRCRISRSAEAAGWPNRPTLRRHDRRAARRPAPRVVPIDMSLRQRVLSAVAHPNVAYLLLSLGMLGSDDRTVDAGRDSARRRRRGVAAAGVLRVPGAARELRGPAADSASGCCCFVLEIKVTSYGLLTAGGLVSLVFGSMILMDSTRAGAAVEPAGGPSGRARVRGDRGVAGEARRRVPAATGGHRPERP